MFSQETRHVGPTSHQYGLSFDVGKGGASVIALIWPVAPPKFCPPVMPSVCLGRILESKTYLRRVHWHSQVDDPLHGEYQLIHGGVLLSHQDRLLLFAQHRPQLQLIIETIFSYVGEVEHTI